MALFIFWWAWAKVRQPGHTTPTSAPRQRQGAHSSYRRLLVRLFLIADVISLDASDIKCNGHACQTTFKLNYSKVEKRCKKNKTPYFFNQIAPPTISTYIRSSISTQLARSSSRNRRWEGSFNNLICACKAYCVLEINRFSL